MNNIDNDDNFLEIEYIEIDDNDLLSSNSEEILQVDSIDDEDYIAEDDYLVIDEIDPDEDEYDYSGRRKKKPKKPHSVFREILSWVAIFAISAAISLFITFVVIINATVPTGSMENTIEIGDRLIGLRLAYLFSDPQRGDIVIFYFPDNEEETYIKRIIGIPGDHIVIDNGLVYVNDIKINEPYLAEPMNIAPRLEYYVPADSYFMMGDNRNHSLDSRSWTNTFVKREKIIGKAWFKYYNGFAWLD